MKQVLLVKSGEIALKGLNKGTFEAILMKNIKSRLDYFGKFTMQKSQSTIYISPNDAETPMEEVVAEISKVFGIATLNLAIEVEKTVEAIQQGILSGLSPQLSQAETFKVDAKRADKNFHLNSPEIQREMGGFILDHFPHLKVQVKSPQLLVMVEVREKKAYIHSGSIKGAGGMPVSCSGKAALLLSGGIDSPVAGYMMAKRGLSVLNIHFESPPYTGIRAKQKVLTLAQKMYHYTNSDRVAVVNLTKVQEAIKDHCAEGLFTIIMRRYMMKIANVIGKEVGCEAIITGESLAQVASQTMKAIYCTDVSSELPVFRPLIGMDKIEIIDLSRKIDTYETSILPFEDCCTVFTPKHPTTRPVLDHILEEETKLNEEALIKEAVSTLQYFQGGNL